MKIIFTITFLCIFFLCSSAQNVAINTDGSTAAASAMLDVKSTAKGLLIPRMSKAQRNAVISPSTGLLVFQNAPDSTGFYYYNGINWNWLIDNKKSDSSYWGLHGNTNTQPPSSANNVPIDYINDTYLGTFEPKDVSMLAGGNELLRLKQFATGGRIGLSNRNPEYSLDIRTTEINNETQIQGLRIISKNLFDISNSSNVNKGFTIGHNPTNENDMVIWNHANNVNGAIRFGLDSYNNTVRPAFNITGTGQGVNQRNPLYFLDIHTQSQFAPANNNLTNKNGIRISYPNQENANNLQRGLFVGVNNNFTNTKSYIWNYADGNGGNSPTNAIYFGVGGDMDLGFNATMELQDGKIMMGHLTDPNHFFPSTLNLQTNYASGAAKNGMSIMEHSSNNESAYFGVDDNNNLTIRKLGTGSIFLGGNTTNHLSIAPIGHVGLGENNPSYPLTINVPYNDKISLTGNTPDHFGFGVINNNLLQIHTASTSDNIAFGSGNSFSFTERARIINFGEYGMQLTGRLLLRSGTESAGIWFNNYTNGGTPVAFNGMADDLHIGFYGNNGAGWGFVMNNANGNVGIGTLAPSEKLEINGKIKITDGTQAAGRVLASDANGVGTWVNNIALTPGVQGVFAGGGVTFGNGTATGATTGWFYANTYIELPPGKWMVFGTYLLNGALAADASVFIRTTFSDSNTGSGNCSPNVVSGCLISGVLSGPAPFGLANGQTIINNNTGATKIYYMWANMAKYGTTPTTFNINAIGSNFWSENQLTAIPMN